MDISVSGSMLVLALLGVIAVVVGLILFVRSMYASQKNKDLGQKYEGHGAKSPLDLRNKYPEVDVFRMSGTFFNFGLLAAIGLTILAFSWTSYDESVIIPADALELEDEIIMEPNPPSSARWSAPWSATSAPRP